MKAKTQSEEEKIENLLAKVKQDLTNKQRIICAQSREWYLSNFHLKSDKPEVDDLFAEIYDYYREHLCYGSLFANFLIGTRNRASEIESKSYNEAFAFVKHFKPYFKTPSEKYPPYLIGSSFIHLKISAYSNKWNTYFSLTEEDDNLENPYRSNHKVLEYFKNEIDKQFLIKKEKVINELNEKIRVKQTEALDKYNKKLKIAEIKKMVKAEKIKSKRLKNNKPPKLSKEEKLKLFEERMDEKIQKQKLVIEQREQAKLDKLNQQEQPTIELKE